MSFTCRCRGLEDTHKINGILINFFFHGPDKLVKYDGDIFLCFQGRGTLDNVGYPVSRSVKSVGQCAYVCVCVRPCAYGSFNVKGSMWIETGNGGVRA